MVGLPRKLALAGGLIAIVAVPLLASPGRIRQLYFEGAAEAVLVRHGEAPAQFRMDARVHQNQAYIPAGEFIMGDGVSKQKFPAHKVYLDAYWIDQFEVTNAMMAICVRSGKCQHPAAYDKFYDQPQYADYPVVYITWWTAEAFCEAAGGKLPTEAQWEKATRGADGRIYPWGDVAPDKALLNFNLQRQGLTSVYDYLRGISPYGLLNMAGNAREWVWDWYAPDYYQHSPYKNPQGPDTGADKSLRGGSYSDNTQEVQAFHRTHHDPNSAGLNRGFRCAYPAAN
jgi:eukaryotic-like serine/threonine-protein kinase